MHEDKVRIKAVCPTVTTESILTIPLADFGLTAADVSGAKLAKPLCVYKTTSAGLGKANTDTIAITGTNLVITEGASGFVTGDIWYIELVKGEIPAATGTASSPAT